MPCAFPFATIQSSAAMMSLVRTPDRGVDVEGEHRRTRRDADVAAVRAPSGGDAGDERAVAVDVVQSSRPPVRGAAPGRPGAAEVGCRRDAAVDDRDARAAAAAGPPTRRPGRADGAGEERHNRGSPRARDRRRGSATVCHSRCRGSARARRARCGERRETRRAAQVASLHDRAARADEPQPRPSTTSPSSMLAGRRPKTITCTGRLPA